jgi:hypothetical protein
LILKGWRADVVSVPASEEIAALIAAVPVGETRTYPTSGTPLSAEQRYLYIGTNWEYFKPRLIWANEPGLRQNPGAPIHGVKRRSIFDAPPCDLRFEGALAKMADIYPVGRGVAFISEKLKSLFETHDPSAIRIRPETVVARGKVAPLYLVEADRILRGVDLGRTTLQIRDQPLADVFVRYVEFPEGVTIRDDIDPAICVFWDYDYANWMWSREFVEICRQAGVKGVRASKSRVGDPGISVEY